MQPTSIPPLSKSILKQQMILNSQKAVFVWKWGKHHQEQRFKRKEERRRKKSCCCLFSPLFREEEPRLFSVSRFITLANLNGWPTHFPFLFPPPKSVPLSGMMVITENSSSSREREKAEGYGIDSLKHSLIRIPFPHLPLFPLSPWFF